ncbi:glycosyl hydrolase [Microbacterium alkaliflavum]|uniref:glycosyl hydrolase n=1 Tax=Microbacterium alkaliflavum TaxID=3248839 RepID=UPI0037CB1B0A
MSRRRLTTNKRRALATTAVVLAGLVAPLGVAGTALAAGQADQPPSAAAFAKLNPVTPLTTASFADPAQANMPWARWNFPPATATIAGLEADIQDAYDHNIAGLEIGQGGVPTMEQLTAIYNKANSLGITISLKAASALPGQTYSNADDYARRTLRNDRLVVGAGQSVNTLLPGPATGNPGTIVAVLAYQCSTAPCGTAGTVPLERSSVIDLTSTITATNTDGYNDGTTAGTLAWTAPSAPVGAQWVVLTFRAVPFGTTPETLSPEGTKQVTDAYDAYFAGGLGDLVKRNGGDFFVDSHASDPWGAPEELWASNMRQEFQDAAGYDIVPDLAALVDPTMAGAGLGGPPSPTALFYSFSDGTATRIRSDFNRVRSTLYTENRIVPFQDWAHTYNMKLRLQQEDGPITSIGDQLQTSAVLDRSEYESLTGSDQADIYRPMASANHMTGNTWYSTECCAVLNNSWMATTQDAIIRMNKEFAGGVNRPVYHVRPYIDTPVTTWPGNGFSATSKVSFSNAWSRVNPYWQDMASINDYFARNNLVLTQGAAKTDVAVYMRNYSSPSAFSTTDPNNRHWMDLGLQQAGYTWDYLDEALFDLPNATVTNKRLAEAGPAYKALIFDQFLYPTSNTARGSLTIEAANDILGYAKAGLPVVFVGAPTGTGGLPVSDDAVLAGIVAQILALGNVHQVASEADVPALLAQLGLKPAAEPAAPTTLLSVHRSDSSVAAEYYYLYNQGVDAAPAGNGTFGKNPSNLYEEPSACRVTTANNPCMATGAAVDTTVTLQGKGAPFLLDTFSGQITPIAQYSTDGDSVTVHVSLARDASTVIALLDQPKKIGVDNLPNRGVAATTADSAAFIGNSLVVRANRAGTYTTTLTNGRSVTSTIANVPAAIDLTNTAWHLDAQDWVPTNPYGTTGEAGTATTKKPVSLDLSALKAWPDIPELARASGIGTYTTTVTLPQGWDSSYGASLSLGQVSDTFTLKVNGKSVPVDLIGANADLGKALKAGANTIEVTVTTTLNNRLFQLDTAVANRGVLQNYGLVGPVVLTPYREATVVGGNTK